MSFYQQVVSQIIDRTHLRRNIIILVAVAASIAAILFGDNLVRLFDQPRASQAAISDEELNRIWETIDRPGVENEKLAHSKLIAVDQGGERYLYMLGGVKTGFDIPNDRATTIVSDQVRRIKLDPIRNTVVGSSWEGLGTSYGTMKFGHMEFGTIVVNGYLYVVGGDLNLPPVVEGQDQSALFYSTIERLNLNTTNPQWEVFALLSGVNFYPEVAADSEGIHVVGGIYGNPFPPLQPEVADTYLTDMIDISGDYSKWTTLNLKDKPVIGNVGLFLDNSPQGGEITGTDKPKPVGGGGGTPGSGGGGTPELDGGRGLVEGVSIQALDESQIKIISPTSDDSLFIGHPAEAIVTTNWSGTPSTNGSLWIRQTPSDQWQLVGHHLSIPNHGTKTIGFDVPSNLSPSISGQLRVCLGTGNGTPPPFDSDSSYCDDLTFDISDTFTLTESEVVITSPEPGDKWYRGTPRDITWETESSVPHVAIWWRPESNPNGWQLVHPNAPNNGSFRWFIQDQVPTGPMRLRVCLGANAFVPNCSGESMEMLGSFTMANHSASFVSPLGQEEWRGNSNQTIRWNADTDHDKLSLWFLRAPGSNWTQLKTDVDVAAGSTQIVVPSGQTSQARLAICLDATKTFANCSGDYGRSIGLYTESQPFTVIEDAHIKVLSPNGGEYLVKDDNYTIRWSGNSPAGYRLEYSVTGAGNSWSLIGSAPGGATEFVWRVPDSPTSHGRIRITDLGSPLNDISDEDFYIVGGERTNTQLTEALLSGKFATTVGEHYVIDPSNPTNPEKFAGELKSDFLGLLATRWLPGTVGSIGHLRFMVTQALDVVPVPQGRYGHRLVKNFAGGSLGVIGGATWAKEIEVQMPERKENFKTFWTIDDQKHPVYTTGGDFEFDFGAAAQGQAFGGYQFVGSTAYAYFPTRALGNRWLATNPTVTTNNGNGSGSALDSRYSLKFSDTPKGRAFFGFAELAGHYTVVGGLENTPTGNKTYEFIDGSDTRYFRVPVASTARSEYLGSAGWTQEASYADRLNSENNANFEPAYNLRGFAMKDNSKAVFYGGQHEFEKPFTSQGGGLTHDHHVPDYGFGFLAKTFMYIPTPDNQIKRWFAMADLGVAGAGGEFGYVQVTPGIYTLPSGSNTTFRAKAYSRNGGEITAATCTWNARGLGTIDNTSGVFTAAEVSGYRKLDRGIAANCTVGGKTLTGYADLGVYELGIPRPEPVLSKVETNYQSIVGVPSFGRQIVATAYDQYYGSLSDTGFEWSLSPDRIGTLAQVNGGIAQFVASADPDVAGEYNDAIQVKATQSLVGGGKVEKITTVDVIIPENNFETGNSSEYFSADYAANLGVNGITTIYHYGGIGSNKLQSLGLFGTGAISGSMTLSPAKILPDGFFASDVTVSLTNALGEHVFERDGSRLAVRIDTSRSAAPLATTDASFRAGKNERVELVGEPASWGMGDMAGELVLVGTDGKARLRIYSNLPTTAPITVRGYVEGNNGGSAYSLNGPLQAFLEVGDLPGVPSQLESSITANKLRVAADNQDASTITVTLKDYLGSPVSGYRVKLTSDRGDSDTISPAVATTNASGQAVFQARSAIKGLSTIRAYYAPTQSQLDSNPTPLIKSLTLEFAAFIASLTPDQIFQGETIESVEAIGNQTSWDQAKSRLSLISPNKSGIAIAVVDDNNQVITDPHIKADNVTKTKFKVAATNRPNTQINLSVTGGGQFYPAGTTTVTTDANGVAYFQYQSGGTPGIAKIKAQVAGGISSPAYEYWFMLEDNANHPYELSVTISPKSDLGNGESAVVRGAVYEYIDGEKTLVTDSLTLSFTSDHGDFDSATKNTQNGYGDNEFTRDQVAGPAQIIVTTQLGSVSLGRRVVISQTDDSNDLSYQSLTVVNDQRLTFSNLVASPSATVGSWLVRVTTDIPTTPQDPQYEVVDYPLEVLANGAITGPRLTQVTPNVGYRDTNQLAVRLVGSGTFFQSGSQVSFQSTTGSSSGITVTGLQRIGPEELVANIDIANTATMGYWNVSVTTNGQVAELPGDLDFLVTTPSDIVVDVSPSPAIIPRDGRATSTVTTFVGRLDQVTGTITPISGIDVAFGFVGGDGGTLAPLTGRTDSRGLVRNLYTTDAGNESDEALIRATATVNGILVANTGLIVKTVYTGHQISLTASPDSLTAAGGSSTLTATVLDAAGSPVANGTSVEFILIGVGSISPSRTTVSGGAGVATSGYSVTAQATPQLPRIIAKATIVGVGVVYSNEIIIPIGVDASKYRVELTADKTSVELGGSDRANLTARLLYTGNGSSTPVGNWPMTFSLSYQQNADYLTVISGLTDSSTGQLNTQFVPGTVTGNVLVTAKPIALPGAQIIISKGANQTVSQQLSTISAVPKYVPADDSSFSVITVTVRNGSNIPLAGKSVSLAASLGTVFPATTATTNALGQATFRLRAGSVGTSNLTATVDGITLTTQAYFVTVGSVVAVTLDTIVPLEAKAYDRAVKLYLREPVSGAQPVIDEAYLTNFADAVIGLPVIYLKPNTTYQYWAKGRYHLARVKPVSVSSSTTLTVNFTATHKGQSKGLLIGDLAPDINNSVPTLWHDNAINTVDVSKIIQAWFKNSYEADFTNDGLVNSIDFNYWTINYGSGAPLP